MSKINRLLIFVLFLSISNILTGISPKREFRGIWLATVNNIDWPSKPGLTAEELQNELTSILNTLEKLNFNAVIFQIRPTGDAFYNSSTEPWSNYLSGIQGKAPDKNWDPLKYIISECHKRGMEIHAWINPFRLSQNLTIEYSQKSIASRHPEWVITYGNKQYLDPGIPQVRDYLNNVVGEVVQKYDIDAIHFDDYFYPYPIAGITFPDSIAFENYNRSYDRPDIKDWRRENVDLIIESLNKTIKRIKPSMKFGVSPFGVWKNFNEKDEVSGSTTTAGNTNYDNLYADVIKWQQKGWIDYMIPQLYWEIGHPAVGFNTLINWWDERSYGRHMYVGHALYKLVESKTPAWNNSDELPEQIFISRRKKDIEGSAFFRMKYLDRNPHHFSDRLENEIYAEKALLPAMPWLDNTSPASPSKMKFKGRSKNKRIEIRYKKRKPKSKDHLGHLIYYSTKKDNLNIGNSSNILCFFNDDKINLSEIKFPSKGKYYLWTTSLDKHHNESEVVRGIKLKLK